MNEIHALSGAYAVDALDDLERRRFEAHLAECADCRAEVASLREAAALLPAISDQRPPAAVRDAVLAGITTVRPLPPVAPPAEKPNRRVVARLLVAAALIALVAGTVVAVHPWQHSRTSVASRVLDAGDAVSREVALKGGGSVTLVRSHDLGRAVLLTHGIPAPPAGKTYELWLQDPRGNMHPAGLVDTGGDRTVVLSGDATNATGAGITVEPAGGSPQPTTAPIALVGFGRA